MCSSSSASLSSRPGRRKAELPESFDESTGMGLGFFIAKTLLERSGARLELANRPAPRAAPW